MLATLLFVIAAHTLGDWMFQTQWMASNKSKSLWPLVVHIAVYTATIAVAGIILFGPATGLLWALANGLVHMGIDAITSRITSWAYKQNRIGLFWKIIGIDQFLHYCCLLSSIAAIA